MQIAVELAQAYRQGQNVPLRGLLTPEEMESDPFPIFHSNMQNIGSLGPITRELGTFYGNIGVVYMTIKSAERGVYDQLSPQDKAKLIEDDIEIWKDATAKGRQIADQLFTF